MVSPLAIGWYYKDDAGGYWFQKDPSVTWTFQISFGVSLQKGIGDASAGVSFSQPIGGDPVYLGTAPPKGAPPHTAAVKCFTQGQSFVPGAWG
jgi:hypothetical protein